MVYVPGAALDLCLAGVLLQKQSTKIIIENHKVCCAIKVEENYLSSRYKFFGMANS